MAQPEVGLDNLKADEIMLSWSPLLTDGSRRLLIWRTDTWASPEILTGQHDQLSALAWAPDSSLLAAASLDGTLLVWGVSHDGQ